MSTEDNNNPPLEPYNDPATEARVVALALGEASDFERAELEGLMADNPALKELCARIQRTDSLLKSSESLESNPQPDSGWKLPEERRSAVLERIKQKPEPKPEPASAQPTAVRRWAFGTWAGAAAAVVLGAFLLTFTIPAGMKSDSAVANAIPGRGAETLYNFADVPETAEANGARPVAEGKPFDGTSRFFREATRDEESWNTATASSELAEEGEIASRRTKLSFPVTPANPTDDADPFAGVREFDVATVSDDPFSSTDPEPEAPARANFGSIAMSSGREGGDKYSITDAKSGDALLSSPGGKKNDPVLSKSPAPTTVAAAEVPAPEPKLKALAANRSDRLSDIDRPNIDVAPQDTAAWDKATIAKIDGVEKSEKIGAEVGRAVTGEARLEQLGTVLEVAPETGKEAPPQELAIATGAMPELAANSKWRWEYGAQQQQQGQQSADDYYRSPGHPAMLSLNGAIDPVPSPADGGIVLDSLVTGGAIASPDDRFGSDAGGGGAGLGGGGIRLGEVPNFAFRGADFGGEAAWADQQPPVDGRGEGQLDFRYRSKLSAATPPVKSFAIVEQQEGEQRNVNLWGSRLGAVTHFAAPRPGDEDGWAGYRGFAQAKETRFGDTAPTSPPADEPDATEGLALPGGASPLGGIAERQIARRLERVKEAESDVELGQRLWKEKDLSGAREKFKEGVDKIPNAPLVADQRAQAVQQFADSSVMLADQKAREGDRKQARQILEGVLAEDVEKKDRLLKVAQGYFDLGDYDEADKQFDDALRIDPYNQDARKGKLEVEHQRRKYLGSARDHTRALLLRKIDGAWETPVPDPLFDGETAKADVATKSNADSLKWALKGEKNSERFSRSRRRSVTLPPSSNPVAASGGNAPESLQELSIIADGKLEEEDDLALYGSIENDGIEDNEAPDGGVHRTTAAGLIASIKPEQAKVALDLEVATADEPFSTFSLNVSDVSFKLAQAALIDNGTWPEAAKIRPEEFVNTFEYGDPAPASGEPVSHASEQCVHPFLPGRNLLRVSMQTAATGRSASTPLRLTVLLDKSGSMERADRESTVAKAMEALAGQLRDGDEITLIGFARTPRLIADRLSGADSAQLAKLVADAPSEGGTNLEEALRLAAEAAGRMFLEGAENRIVLLTDGAANLGELLPDSLQQQVISLREQGIALDACGVGFEGLDDEKLEALTRKGDGRYYVLDRPEDADAGFVRQLAGALRPAARNVKVQVEFNPERVASYRLSGFEKHRLEKEDFRNDKVDAAELAAAESGNAVYQIEIDPAGQGPVGKVFVRFRDAATGDMVERSWPIPYQPSAPALGDASVSMKTAAIASVFAEKLKGEPLGELVPLDELAPVASSLRGTSEKTDTLIDMIEKARSLSQ